MGLGKWIVGGIVTAVAAPFVLPAATVAAIGGAVTAGVGAVATGVAAAGTALFGGMTVASVVKGAGLILLGVMLNESDAADRETKAYKRGYENASKEYEGKLRKQADVFLNLLAQAEKNNADYKLRAETAESIAWQALELVKEFEGCINGLKNRGQQIDAETAGYYQHLKEVRSRVRTSRAA